MSLDVLILAAFDPELAPLHAALGEKRAGLVAGRSVAARTVGIGLPAAAAGASARLGELAPRAVVLIGSCGTYATAGLAMGEVAVARRFHLIDLSVLDGGSEFPDAVSATIEAHDAMTGALAGAGARACRLATTLAITVDDRVAQRIAERAAVDVEHLEAHGVAAACAAHRVPFAAVLGVANSVGARGRIEWRTHHHRAEAAACAVVMRWLESGGAGLDP